MKKEVQAFLNQALPTVFTFTPMDANQPTNKRTCSRMEEHKQTPTPACNRDSREETDRGKPLERQITGLDKLHFDCDHESCLDAPLVFAQLTTAALALQSLKGKMAVFQNNNVSKSCMKLK